MTQRRLFGTDGIRGVAGQYPLDNETIRLIGAAAASVLTKRSRRPLIVMGRDTRESGAGIALQLKREFSRAGIEVWDLGVIPTPGIAYAIRRHPVIAGVVISASHNPFHDNGIKFFGPKGTKLPDSLEAMIESRIRAFALERPALRRTRRAVRHPRSLVKEYAAFLAGTFPKGLSLRGMRIVIDCANGATCEVAGSVLSSLGAAVTELNVSPDGRNINAGSGALHPEGMAREVVRRGACCGLAFDGDGDRIIFSDEKGVIRDGDFLLSIAATSLKRQGKLRNNLLVTTVMANLGLVRAMERAGIEVAQTPVGDRYVFEEMKRRGGVVGGEQSGHIIFRRFLSTGDGILSAIQVLGIAAADGRPFSELCAVMKKYPQVLINTPVARKVPIEALPETTRSIAAVQESLKGDGRVLVRYSGTENLLRVMIEGQDQGFIDQRAREIVDTAVREIGRAPAG